MTWVAWRQNRITAAISGVLLAAVAALLLITGFQVAAQWHAALAGCTAAGSCASLKLGDSAVGFLVIMTLGVPVVLGMFWGAPLIAREFEAGTSQFAWTQAVTRTRWLAVTAGSALLAAAICSGAVSALVTWWSGPDNAQQLDAFKPGRFDIMGIVPIGYALFATALGIAAGAVFRRTLAAIAVTLLGFMTVRFVIFFWVRAHFIGAVTTYTRLGNPFVPTGSFWQLSRGFVNGNGRPIVVPGSVNGAVIGGLPVNLLPPACQALGSGPQAQLCASAHGIRQYLSYQPSSRYWAFQGIETGIFVALAAALVGVAFLIVRRRDV